jgi:fibronectin-binding autotransporter adhesin
MGLYNKHLYRLGSVTIMTVLAIFTTSMAGAATYGDRSCNTAPLNGTLSASDTVDGNLSVSGTDSCTVFGTVDGNILSSSSGTVTLNGILDGNIELRGINGKAAGTGRINGNIKCLATGTSSTFTGPINGNIECAGTAGSPPIVVDSDVNCQNFPIPGTLSAGSVVNKNVLVTANNSCRILGHVKGNILSSSSGSVTIGQALPSGSSSTTLLEGNIELYAAGGSAVGHSGTIKGNIKCLGAGTTFSRPGGNNIVIFGNVECPGTLPGGGGGTTTGTTFGDINCKDLPTAHTVRSGQTVDGNLTVDGGRSCTVELNGKVDGNILNNTGGTVTLNGVLDGNIELRGANGKAAGNGRINGNIKCLATNTSSTFNGFINGNIECR